MSLTDDKMKWAPNGCAAGCMLIAFGWLAVSILFCIFFYRQETSALSNNDAISRNLAVTQGKITYASGRLIGRGKQYRRYYRMRYQFQTSNGGQYSGNAMVNVGQLGVIGLSLDEAEKIWKAPRPCTIEYDKSNPLNSRLQGLSFDGNHSQYSLWGGMAIGAFIGVFGFLFLGGPVISYYWKRHKGTSTYNHLG